MWFVQCTAGSGIYVTYSATTATGSSTGAQPNNSYGFFYISRYQSNRFNMYCCSNSSSSLGTIQFPDGVSRTGSNYNYGYIQQNMTSTYGGCVYFYFHSYSWFTLYSPGIYTFYFDNNETSSIGLYEEESRCKFNYISIHI